VRGWGGTRLYRRALCGRSAVHGGLGGEVRGCSTRARHRLFSSLGPTPRGVLVSPLRGWRRCCCRCCRGRARTGLAGRRWCGPCAAPRGVPSCTGSRCCAPASRSVLPACAAVQPASGPLSLSLSLCVCMRTMATWAAFFSFRRALSASSCAARSCSCPPRAPHVSRSSSSVGARAPSPPPRRLARPPPALAQPPCLRTSRPPHLPPCWSILY
jgi:hypothetical protein